MPAFSGLYAPHWDASARGVIAGLTRFASKGHLARAVLMAEGLGLQVLPVAATAPSLAIVQGAAGSATARRSRTRWPTPRSSR